MFAEFTQAGILAAKNQSSVSELWVKLCRRSTGLEERSEEDLVKMTLKLLSGRESKPSNLHRLGLYDGNISGFYVILPQLQKMTLNLILVLRNLILQPAELCTL